MINKCAFLCIIYIKYGSLYRVVCVSTRPGAPGCTGPWIQLQNLLFLDWIEIFTRTKGRLKSQDIVWILCSDLFLAFNFWVNFRGDDHWCMFYTATFSAEAQSIDKIFPRHLLNRYGVRLISLNHIWILGRVSPYVTTIMSKESTFIYTT